MKKLAFVFLLFCIFQTQSCSRKIITQTHTVYDTTSIVVRDRVIDTFIDRDTITTTIEVGCDSLNKPFVKGTGIKTGKRSILYSSFNNGRLDIQANCNELLIQLRTKDSIIRKQTIELKDYKTVIVKKPSFWDYLKMIGLHILYVASTIVAYELIRKLYDQFH